MNEEITETVSRKEVMRLSVDIVAAYVSQNNVNGTQIPDLIAPQRRTRLRPSRNSPTATESTTPLRPLEHPRPYSRPSGPVTWRAPAL